MVLIIGGFVWTAVAIAIAVIFLHKKFVWWEYLILGLTPIAIAFIALFLDEQARIWDTEYRTSTLTYAEYVEPYSTWVTKECSKRVCDTKRNSDGTTYEDCHTEYYDCSECDRFSARWYVYDNNGKQTAINEYEYKRLCAKFGNNSFVELNRNITYRLSCGVDGDKYVTTWDGNPDRYEHYATAHNYENKVRLSNSFNFHKLTEAEKKRVKDYPAINHVYQPSIVGQWYDKQDYATALQKLDRFNGLNGKKKQIKVFMFLYHNESPDVVDLQRNYFEGGNKNEMIVCIGYDNAGKTQWVRAFSWTDEKICEVEATHYAKPDMKLTDLVDYMVPIWYNNWKRKEFTPMNELVTMVPTGGAIFGCVITQLIVLGLMLFGFTKNEHYNF